MSKSDINANSYCMANISGSCMNYDEMLSFSTMTNRRGAKKEWKIVFEADCNEVFGILFYWFCSLRWHYSDVEVIKGFTNDISSSYSSVVLC